MREQTQHRAVCGCANIDETGTLTLGQEFSGSIDSRIAKEKPGNKRKNGVGKNAMFCEEFGKTLDSFAADQETDRVEYHQHDHNGRKDAGDICDEIFTAGCKHAGKCFSKGNH